MKKPPSRRTVEKMRERERTVGLDPDDGAAAWLAENEPKEELPTPKAARKSKLLHQWRSRERRQT